MMKYALLLLSIHCTIFLLTLLIKDSEACMFCKPTCPPHRPHYMNNTRKCVRMNTSGNNIKKETFNFKPPEICGKRLASQGLVIGGQTIKRGEFPWNVALVDNNNELFCGGTIISNKIIVTAAHCIQEKYSDEILKPNDVTPILGAHNLTKLSETGRITASVERIYIHPDWNVNSQIYDADIAVLELKNEIEFSTFIQPICLVGPITEIANAARGIAVGFGRTDNEHLLTSSIANKLTITIKNHLTCTKESNDHQQLITHRNFCGEAAAGRGICNGDSGSGFYISYDNSFYLRGIVSASLMSGYTNDCNVNSFGIYTSVVNFHEWIKSGGENLFS